MSVSTDPGAVAPAAAPANGSEPRRRATFGAAVLAGVLVFGLIVGLAIGFLGPRLTTPGDDSVEAGFLRDMSTHHAQAGRDVDARPRRTRPHRRSSPWPATSRSPSTARSTTCRRGCATGT
jgi:hypothetical protein